MKTTLFFFIALITLILLTTPLDAMHTFKTKKSPTEKCWDGIEFREPKKISKAIKNGADVNLIIIDYYNANEPTSLLQLALSTQHIPTVQELLKAPNLETNSYPIGTLPPLHYAVSSGKSELVRLLLAHPKTNKNILDAQGNTCLFKAVDIIFTSTLSIGKMLLDHNLDATIINKEGDNILHYVSNKRDASWTKLILATKNPPLNIKNKKGNTPLHVACKTNAYSVVETILESKHLVDFTLRNNDNDSVLDIVLDNKYDDIISLFFDIIPKRFMCKHGKDKRFLDYTIRTNKPHILKRILPSPYVDGEKNWVPLIAASERGYIDIVTLLLKQHNCDHLQMLGDGRIALHYASKKGHLECVKKLSKHDSNLDYQDDCENTPLHLACINQHIDVIDYLIEKGANTLIHNEDGLIPFIIMYQKNIQNQVKQTTLQRMLHVKDIDNNILFHKLAEMNNSLKNDQEYDNLLVFLIGKKLNIYARNKNQLTPLDIINGKLYPHIFLSGMMQSFRRVTSDNMHYILFKEILDILPKDLRISILILYYKLNIETIFAKIAKIKPFLLGLDISKRSNFKEQLTHDCHYFPLLYRPTTFSYE